MQNLFIVILSYKVDLDEIDKHRDAHMSFLAPYYEDGTFLLSGPRVPREGGVILAKTASKQELQEILEQDPFAMNDLAHYDIYEFSPTKSSL